MIKEKRLTTKTIDVLGIGNAIVDVIAHVEDTFLEKHCFKKGSMTLINEEEAEKLYSEITAGIQSPGGSAANTITGIAQLGGNTGFIGRVKDDQLGKIFTKEICASGAIFTTPSVKEGPSTARCMIFVSSDAERTMCTFLGASVKLSPNDLDLSLVKQSKILYLEGYLWDDKLAKEAFIKAADICKSNGGEVALSLSDSFCVERHRESFKELIDGHIDILFANEEEIKALYETQDLELSMQKLNGKCKIAAITLGSKGSLILQKEHQIVIPAFKLGETIDTTGAGDLYAGGFLYGYTQGRNISTCGNIASLCAAHIVTQLGARTNIPLRNLVDLIIK